MTEKEVTVPLKAGDVAPAFCLPDKDNQNVCLNDFTGMWVVLYFYPRDNTSGCTREALDFSAALDDLKRLNAVVLGVSADSVESHRKFVAKHHLSVRLLSDVEHQVLAQYGAWQLKQLYGKEFWGTVRSTVLIAPDGVIAHIWPKVQVKGHVEAVKQQLEELQT
ncbi:MAG TPA: peroxiredoxin [Methanomicrobia archaeon]|nr:peroxiredoxin [Methanomicrobia archaeon]